MRSRLHSRLAAVLILGFSAHGADAESPVSAGLTEQALHRLSGKTQALPDRTFLRTAFRSTIEASIRQPITTYRLGKAIYRQRGMALLEKIALVLLSIAPLDGLTGITSAGKTSGCGGTRRLPQRSARA